MLLALCKGEITQLINYEDAQMVDDLPELATDDEWEEEEGEAEDEEDAEDDSNKKDR